MKTKIYKVKFIVEKTYNAEIETPIDHTPGVVKNNIMEIMQEDYLSGNMDNETDGDHHFKIAEIEEIVPTKIDQNGYPYVDLETLQMDKIN
tara:strand:+ start:197 stop:469 length:273 start_codon:yes stop_codon:yes gene_type:complete